MDSVDMSAQLSGVFESENKAKEILEKSLTSNFSISSPFTSPRYV